MENPYHIPKLTVEKLRFSVVVVRPKEPFLQLLKTALSLQKLPFEKVYFQEEIPVFLIPPMDIYHSTEDFERLLADLKPRIIRYIAGLYGAADKNLCQKASVE